jgi:hypothetical protein
MARFDLVEEHLDKQPPPEPEQPRDVVTLLFVAYYRTKAAVGRWPKTTAAASLAVMLLMGAFWTMLLTRSDRPPPPNPRALEMIRGELEKADARVRGTMGQGAQRNESAPGLFDTLHQQAKAKDAP